MYLIAYIVIGLSLGGIVYIVVRRLPGLLFEEKKGGYDLRMPAKSHLLDKDSVARRFKLWLQNVKTGLLKTRDYFSAFLGYSRRISQAIREKIKVQERASKAGRVISQAWTDMEEVASRIHFQFPKGKSQTQVAEREAPPLSEQDEEFFSELLEEEEDDDIEKTEPAETETATEEKLPEREDFRKQEQALIKSLKQNPRDGILYEDLGLLYYKQGDLGKARECLKTAVKLGAEDKEVKEILEEIGEE